MERRPYFIAGDLLVNVLVGGLTAAAVRGVVEPGWNPLLAMLVGMICGMLVSAPVGIGFVPLFGALEVMLPATFTGMISGMVVGMLHAMRGLHPGSSLLLGAVLGLGSIGWVYFLTARERRHGSPHRT